MEPLYTLLAIGTTLSSFAQQGVLTSNEMPPVGTSVTYRTASNLNVVDTTAGANVTWNMAGFLPTTQTPWSLEYMAPTSSPHPTAFPASNYCQYESVIPRYNYYNLSSSSMEKVGSWATSINTYTDGQVELVFPLQLGTTNNDTWDNTNSSFGGTYNITCIGSGTLNLPMGTFSDALLVRVNVFEIFTVMQYQWYDATNGAVLLAYVPGDGLFVPAGAAYMVNVAIGIEELSQPLELRVHGVANDELLVSYASAAPIGVSVRSYTGQLVRSTQWPASPSPSTRSLGTADLASGVYILQIHGKDGSQQVQRFVKP